MRYQAYGIKILRRSNNTFDIDQFVITVFKDPKERNIGNFTKMKVYGVVIHFLFDDEIPKIQEHVEAMLAINPKLKIYVIALFATIEAMTALTRWSPNLYVINILCVVNMQLLLNRLHNNRKDQQFKMDEDPDVINGLLVAIDKLLPMLADQKAF